MGGAWKVAYADFVTAMMALFMVLWISAQDDEIVFKTVQYFKDPFGLGFEDGQRGSLSGGEGSSSGGSGAAEEINKGKPEEAKTSMLELAFLEKLSSEYYRLLNVDESDEEAPVRVEVTADGLRITLYNKSDKPLFKEYTAEFTDWGLFVMQNLAWLMDRNKMKIRIDSHVPTGLIVEDKNYGPWELTTDRSNAARRKLEFYSISDNKICEVSGYSDMQPLAGLDPKDPKNQRLAISLVLE